MLFWYSTDNVILLLSCLACHKVENSCHSSIASTLSCLLWGACWDLAEPLDTSPGREGPFTAPFLFPTPGKPSQGQAGSTLSMPPKPSEPILIKPACDDYWGREWKTDWEQSPHNPPKGPRPEPCPQNIPHQFQPGHFFALLCFHLEPLTDTRKTQSITSPQTSCSISATSSAVEVLPHQFVFW